MNNILRDKAKEKLKQMNMTEEEKKEYEAYLDQLAREKDRLEKKDEKGNRKKLLLMVTRQGFLLKC